MDKNERPQTLLNTTAKCAAGLCLSFFVAIAVPATVGASGPAAPSAALPVAVDAPELTKVLSEKDEGLYRKIFGVQKKGDWKAADALIAKLEDRVLMGHVMAQRYLHPRKYRSKYKELKTWMGDYADHPQARQIYKLAMRRKPRKWHAPKAPVPVKGIAAVVEDEAAVVRPKGKRLSRSQRRQVRSYQRKIRWYLRKGWTKAVKKLIRTSEVKRLFSQVQMDEAKSRLAAGYFAAGRDEWALSWAEEAARHSGPYVSNAHWTAGLASWRLGSKDVSARHFEAILKGAERSPWMVSAAAFWAARAHLVNRNPQAVTHHLQMAAAYPKTFYGLLARRILGLPNTLEWELPAVEQAIVADVAKTPTGRRALALVQVDDARSAERELRNLAGRTPPEMARGILLLASRTDMPALAVKLDTLLFPNGGGYDAAAYPLPSWQPENGFRIDRALVYAMIRQESRFNPKAKSWAGARGLMQLMPGTAAFTARDRRFRRGAKRNSLYQPKVNLTLGQKYIEILLSDSKIKGDLFLMAAAWNGGPGNLNKWRRNTNNLGDPLFFIESIPSRETRGFIEKVFANLWIYRDRLGQPKPSLDAIAEGDWPVYTAVDKESTQVAENGENRRRTGVPPR